MLALRCKPRGRFDKNGKTDKYTDIVPDIQIRWFVIFFYTLLFIGSKYGVVSGRHCIENSYAEYELELN